MKISAFADVCLRTLMLLASHPDQLRTAQHVAEGIGVPYNQVTKAVVELRRLGLIDVTRGRTGGARISEVGLHTTVGDALRRLDDNDDVVGCVHTDDSTCPLLPGCRLRSALRVAREAFYSTLDSQTIEDLTAPSVLLQIGKHPPA